MKRFLLWLLRPLLLRTMHKIDRKAKCPACGIVRRHKIVFHPAYLKIIHECRLCTAQWGENPVVAAESWRVHTGMETEPEITQAARKS